MKGAVCSEGAALEPLEVAPCGAAPELRAMPRLGRGLKASPCFEFPFLLLLSLLLLLLAAGTGWAAAFAGADDAGRVVLAATLALGLHRGLTSELPGAQFSVLMV